MKSLQRGLLIVFEGCDRSGKTTHCQRLVQELNSAAGLATKAMRFPDRSTYIGKVIDEYLRGQTQVEDHAIHLLFSSNRWEKVCELNAALAAGVHVVVDRYAFSGVAFSAAKDGLGVEWCKQPDRGLPRPDLVCFLDVSPEEAKQRGGFGEERYEKAAFQAKVRANYDLLMDESWKKVSTDRKTLDEVFREVSQIVTETIKNHDNAPLRPLWPLDDKSN